MRDIIVNKFSIFISMGITYEYRTGWLKIVYLRLKIKSRGTILKKSKWSGAGSQTSHDTLTALFCCHLKSIAFLLCLAPAWLTCSELFRLLIFYLKFSVSGIL